MPDMPLSIKLDLYNAAQEWRHRQSQADMMRDSLSHGLYEVSTKYHPTMRELSAYSGLHHATIRALISRVAPHDWAGWAELTLPGMDPAPATNPANSIGVIAQQGLPTPIAMAQPAPCRTSYPTSPPSAPAVAPHPETGPSA